MRGKKKCQKNFRISEAQNTHVMECCKKYGINESEYFRRLIDSDMGKIVSTKTHEEYRVNKALVYEVNQIGNNINQITKNVNSHFYTEYEKRKLFAMMEKIKEILTRIVA